MFALFISWGLNISPHARPEWEIPLSATWCPARPGKIRTLAHRTLTRKKKTNPWSAGTLFELFSSAFRSLLGLKFLVSRGGRVRALAKTLLQKNKNDFMFIPGFRRNIYIYICITIFLYCMFNGICICIYIYIYVYNLSLYIFPRCPQLLHLIGVLHSAKNGAA